MKSLSKIVLTIFIALSLVSIFSFTKIGSTFLENVWINNPQKKVLFNDVFKTTYEEDNYVAIISSFTINPTRRDSSYKIQAFGKITENDIPINAGPIQIGNKTLYTDSNNLYSYDYSLSDGKSLFGSTVNVSIQDSSSRGQTLRRLTGKVIVVPKEIFPTSMALPGSTVDRTRDYQLNWAPDPNNQFQQVQIQISYYKGISQYNASGMPNAINDLVFNVPDNGNFTITQADLSRYPKGAYIGLSISRASLDNTSGNIAYVSIVEAHSVPLLVVEPSPLNITISGPDGLCSSSTYHINNLPLGCSVIWSVTPTGVVSLSPNGETVTLSKLSSGNITLKGTLAGACSNLVIPKPISVGTPIISGSYTDQNGQHSLQYWTGSPSSYNLACNNYNVQTNISVQNASSVTWTRVSASPSSLSWNQSGNNINFYFWQPNQTAVYKVEATNVCGTTTKTFGFKSINCNGGVGGCEQFTISPNPSNGTLLVVVPNIPAPCDVNLSTTAEQKPMQPKRAITQIYIYDNGGSLKKSLSVKNARQANVNLSGLVPGVYFVEVKDGAYTERKKVVLQ